MQYRESDLDFVSRLLEEEGIFYYFEHSEDAHTLILSDASAACEAVPGDPRLVFREPSGMVAGSESVHEFSARVEVQPGAVLLRTSTSCGPTGPDRRPPRRRRRAALEVYDYPAA